MTKFVLFLLTYSFTKIIRVMAAATVPMAAAFCSARWADAVRGG